jgi:threonine aldolase
MQALIASNHNHAVGYGDDPWTASAGAAFKRIFGPGSETFFVLNGTGANVLALSLAAGQGQSVLCSQTAHIATDEAGAPEANIGCKLLPLESRQGKIKPEAIGEALGVLGNLHHAQPSCLSISQCTELGTIYSMAELEELTGIAHRAGLIVHMDGARYANAAVALGVSLAELAKGVDILSFGGMKNGVAFGEALVVLNPALAGRVPFMRKTRLQLASKMRFISAQYEAYLAEGVWKRNATAANAAAARLADLVKGIPGVELQAEVQANAVFVRLPKAAADSLRKEYFFYDLEAGVSRWMTSFDTTEADIMGFVSALRRHLGA